MAGTWSNSMQLIKESLEVLKQDKELILFPVLSGIASIIMLGLIMVPGVFLSGITAGETSPNIVFYLFFILYYFIASFIVIFFNTGLIACAQIRLNGGDPTFSDGMRYATENIGKILGWSLINASVGLILRMIRERLGIAGAIIGGILAVGWNLITFFVIPVIIFEQIGVIDSIKRSVSLFKNTWGENMVVRFSVALIFFVLGLAGVIPIVLAAFTQSVAVIIPVVVVVVIYWVVLAVIAMALNGIFATALYDYATTGQVPTAFSPEVITNAFAPKPQRRWR